MLVGLFEPTLPEARLQRPLTAPDKDRPHAETAFLAEHRHPYRDCAARLSDGGREKPPKDGQMAAR
jgi:hypothetical protein